MARSSNFTQAITAAVRQAKRALADISLGDNTTAEYFPATLVDSTLAQLERSGYFVRPRVDENKEIPVADFLNEMAQLLHATGGFTLAPLPDASGNLLQPSDGHCVALPGTDYTIKRAFRRIGTSARVEPTNQGVYRLSRWVDFMEPVLRAGMVWIGGFSTNGTTFVTEDTLVFKATHNNVAQDVALKWEQHSYWTIDPVHPSGKGGYSTPVGGTPCDSVFDALETHR